MGDPLSVRLSGTGQGFIDIVPLAVLFIKELFDHNWSLSDAKFGSIGCRQPKRSDFSLVLL